LLVKIGEYKKGSDPLADEALSRIDAIRAFLRQRGEERPSFEDTVETMRRLVG
jgi:ATP synthase in type III secretion protein N